MDDPRTRIASHYVAAAATHGVAGGPPEGMLAWLAGVTAPSVAVTEWGQRNEELVDAIRSGDGSSRNNQDSNAKMISQLDGPSQRLIKEYIGAKGAGECLWHALRIVWGLRGNSENSSLEAWYADATGLWRTLFIDHIYTGNQTTRHRVTRLLATFKELKTIGDAAASYAPADAQDREMDDFPASIDSVWPADINAMQARWGTRNYAHVRYLCDVFGVIMAHIDGRTPVLPVVSSAVAQMDAEFVTAVYGGDTTQHCIITSGNHFEVICIDAPVTGADVVQIARAKLAYELSSNYCRAIMGIGTTPWCAPWFQSALGSDDGVATFLQLNKAPFVAGGKTGPELARAESEAARLWTEGLQGAVEAYIDQTRDCSHLYTMYMALRHPDLFTDRGPSA